MNKIEQYIDEFLVGLGLTNTEIGLAFIAIFLLVARFKYHVYCLERVGSSAIGDEARAAKRSFLLSQRRYRDWLTSMLGALDKYFGPGPYGCQTLNRCMKLAIAYPVIVLFLAWGLSGENASGIDGLLPQATSARRLSATFALFGLIVGVFQGTRAEKIGRRLFWVLISVVSALSVSQIVGMTAATIAGLGAFAFGFAVLGGRTIKIAVSVSIGLVISLVAIGEPIPGSFLLSVFVLGSSAFFALKLRDVGVKVERERIGYAGVFLFLAALIVLGSIFIGRLGTSTIAASFLIFGVFLPAVNSLFDWVSVGTTRILMHRTAMGGNPVANALADLGAAILILIALISTTTLLLHGLNSLARMNNATMLVNICKVISSIEASPSSAGLYWIYAMLMTTLIPTFVHAYGASVYLLTVTLPKSWTEKHVSAVLKGFDGNPRALIGTAAWLTFRDILGVFVALLSLSVLVVLPVAATIGVERFGVLLAGISGFLAGC